MENRTCTGCGFGFPPTGEYFYRIGKDQKYFTKKCKKCYPSGAAQRKKRKEENRSTESDLRHEARMIERGEIHDRVMSIKLERGCVDCGYKSHSAALEYDHLPGTDKKFCVSLCYHRTWDEVVDEIAKCEVVCANCHRIRSTERKKKP